MPETVRLSRQQEAALQAQAEKFIAAHKGDAVAALKAMMILNAELQSRLDKAEAANRRRRETPSGQGDLF